MEHQYPGAISGDENMLAELMLPDQAHNRKQDWTIFFLHKDTGEVDEAAEEAKRAKRERKERRERRKQEAMKDANGEKTGEEIKGAIDPSDDDAEDKEEGQEEVEGGEGPPLIYVLNLVNTKQDTTAKRLVKQMRLYIRAKSRPSIEVQSSKPWPYVPDIPFYIYTRYTPFVFDGLTWLIRCPAFIIISIRRILQIAISRNIGVTLRCGQCNGPVFNAPALYSRTTSITSQ